MTYLIIGCVLLGMLVAFKFVKFFISVFLFLAVWSVVLVIYFTQL